MLKRPFGRTGLNVTVLGHGAMEIRGPRIWSGREVTEPQAEMILNAVLDSGINFIDTSIDYGLSEARIGKYISHRRSEYFLATKCGCWALPGEPPGGGDRFPHVFTAENIRAGIEQSLRRMKTDYVDLLQFHSSPSKATMEEHGCLQTLLDLKKEGKVRFIGVSGTFPNITEQIELGVFDEFQIPYSALERKHEDVIHQASQAGAGIVIRGGAAKGGPGKEQGSSWDIWQQVGIDELLGDMSRMEFVLRFTYSHPDLDTTIVGTVNPDHLMDNLNALLKGPLPADIYEGAKRRLAMAGSVPA